jgi:amino acid adenylation domain-containing protein
MRRHILDAIFGHAQSTPDKCALSDSSVTIQYAQLDSFSTRFAVRLRELGCVPGSRVVVVAYRRASLVAAILGTFKAGCIHVPVDPRMPSNRLDYILTDISPTVVVADDDLGSAIATRVGPHVTILLVSELERLLAADATEDVPTLLYHTERDAPAYCIYTSGSTGHPKGVLIDHRSIADFLDGAVEVYDVTADSVCASFSPLHFDVFLIDMLLPLAQGARLHVYDDVVVPDLIFDMIRENGVTHFSAFGMMLGLIAQASEFPDTALPRLKTILTGTDVPDVKTVQLWLRKNTDLRVINGYGPTETTCAATGYVIREIEPDRRELYPIGRPLKHVTAFLVGSQGERIDIPHTPGELLIGGNHVMRGYWNRPDETAARLCEIDGIRCYRTGDICSYLPDGNIYYIGRKDHEVNIGGYRVHLNEVRRVINSIPHVHDSEIVTVKTVFDEKVLAAGIVLDTRQHLHVPQYLQLIQRRLAEELPNYMVPRYVAILDQFPQLSSGKTDRNNLQWALEYQMNTQSSEVMTS